MVTYNLPSQGQPGMRMVFSNTSEARQSVAFGTLRIDLETGEQKAVECIAVGPDRIDWIQVDSPTGT